MDKKIFLLDKEKYPTRPNVTEKDLEEWVAEMDYDDNYSIIKIDGNNTCSDTIYGAIRENILTTVDDYHIFAFGYNINEELAKNTHGKLVGIINEEYNEGFWVDFAREVLNNDCIEDVKQYFKDYAISEIVADFTLEECIKNDFI